MVQLVVASDFWVSRIYPEGVLENWLARNGAHVEFSARRLPICGLRASSSNSRRRRRAS